MPICRYFCSVCKSKHETLENAEKCENSHFVPNNQNCYIEFEFNKKSKKPWKLFVNNKESNECDVYYYMLTKKRKEEIK